MLFKTSEMLSDIPVAFFIVLWFKYCILRGNNISSTMYVHKHLTVNSSTIEPYPFVREITMEAYLMENESVLALNKVLNDVTIMEGRVKLSGEAGASRIDMLAKYGQDYLAMVQVKKGSLNESHLNNLQQCLKQDKEILAKHSDIWDSAISAEPKWMGVLVGQGMDTDLLVKLRTEYFEKSNTPIAILILNRYRGRDGNVYIMTDTYQTTKIGGKDYRQYEFNGQLYGKGRLVLAVLKEHVQRNPAITYSKLDADFPSSLQGTEVFTKYGNAMERYNKTGKKRNFIESDELVFVGENDSIAVSREWGIGNISRFLARAAELGYKII